MAQEDRTRARRIGSSALAVFAAVALLLCLLTLYANRVLFDSDQFANHVGVAVEQPAVEDEVGRRIADGILKKQPDLVGVRPIIEGAAAGVVGSGPFNDLLRAGVRDVHRVIFKHDEGTVTLAVADIGVVVSSALEQFAPRVAKKVHAQDTARLLDGDAPDWVLGLARLAEDARVLAIVLLVLALAAAGGGLALSPDWRRYLSFLGTSIAVTAVVLLIGYRVSRSLVLDKVPDPDGRAAVASIWGTFLGNLRTTLLIAAGAGVILAAATRSLFRPVRIERSLERAWQVLTRVPERPAARAARALALIAIGLLVVLNPDPALELAVLVAGLYILYKGGEELLRLIAPPPGAVTAPAAGGGRPDGRRRRRIALAAATAVFAGVVAAGVVTAFSGSTKASPAIRGCNGSGELCDKPLGDLILPAAHNAMSGADIPNYLFANQDHAIPRQLEAGVRGLLIDSHYGIPANGGAVKTDLEDFTNVERRKYVKEIGKQAVDAALEIRDRLVTGGDGEHQIYLCHRFCELGAVPLGEALGQIRDFVVSQPNQVVVIVNEDYVSPTDFVSAVKESGLDDYVYRGPITPSTPTAGDMVASGHRVVLMAENEGGAEPWYRNGYSDVLQETPYSFKDPSELIANKGLAKTCQPNRGSEDNPLFLLNHWIDTSPSPKPTNAAQVNAYEALLARARECERARGQLPNLIAVDFYATGDLTRVVDKLNGVAAKRGG